MIAWFPNKLEQLEPKNWLIGLAPGAG